MRLTVFGATGGTGRQIVAQALDAGHDVTAVVRDPAALPARHARLDVRRADVLDPDAIESTVKSADAVVSALGPRKGGRETICSESMRSILTAMRGHDVRRILAISAAPVVRNDPGERLVYRVTVRPLLTTLLRKVYTDLAEMERLLAESGTEWTIMRPPRLTGKPLTGCYRTDRNRNIPGGYRISRADLAQAMLLRLDDPDAIRAAIGIGY